MREGILGLWDTLVHRGSRAGGTSSQAGVGLLDHLHAQLLGGEGAGSEVFPGHKATRGSPGGCNCSSASILLSGPVPRACYCRCRAAFPPPPACPCPLHCTLSLLTPATWGCPILPGALILFPCILLPSPAGFCLLIQGLCSSHQVHPAKLPAQVIPRGPWSKASVALATKDHPQHSDVPALGSTGQEELLLSLPFSHLTSPLLSLTSPGSAGLQSPLSALPAPSASPGPLCSI